MAQARFNVLSSTLDRKPNSTQNDKASSVFATDVFNDYNMQLYIQKDAYKNLKNTINKNKNIDQNTAEQAALGMKAWAMSKGVTHYTHWFQPLTGGSAEKHDAFFEPLDSSTAIEKFNATALIQQEPDASSFPNGGIRNTFEARGYTAWDPSSPAFIIEQTLCIPTIFISYTGETLDHKTPLLRSIHELDTSATEVAKYFDKNVTKVHATLGWEQEYFLIDEAFISLRPDLQLTGRTLVGHASAKGQQLDDHYFGSIPKRVMAFMKDLENSCLRLGIPLKTRHNEVAPNQFELAPIFEEVNLAVDHNTLLMDVMDKVSQSHGFRVLLHEKPFAGVNGSGKHNNWSLQTNTGENLLSPGSKPKVNLQFLTFFINTIKAVHDYSDLLRGSISSAGNEHRLGANEAPPAIISVFIGSHLTKVLEEIENVSDGKLSPDEKTELKLNIIGKIPEILLDNTDRNRTSPFAFTGNKFEFRAVGSKSNCALPMMVLNTIVANQLNDFKEKVDARIEGGLKKDDAIFNELRELVKSSKKVLFEGDGYSEEWKDEAKKRGLSNVPEATSSYEVFESKETIDLFEKLSVLTKNEIESRNEVRYEQYFLQIQIEARVLGEMILNQVIPAAIKYQKTLSDNIINLKSIYGDKHKELAKEQILLTETLSNHINTCAKLVVEMIDTRKKLNKIEDSKERSKKYNTEVKPYFDKIRYHADKLEFFIDDQLWPLPKYREMLISR